MINIINHYLNYITIPKTQKMVLGVSLLKTQHHKVLTKSKWSYSGKRVALSPTPQCCSY